MLTFKDYNNQYNINIYTILTIMSNIKTLKDVVESVGEVVVQKIELEKFTELSKEELMLAVWDWGIVLQQADYLQKYKTIIKYTGRENARLYHNILNNLMRYLNFIDADIEWVPEKKKLRNSVIKTRLTECTLVYRTNNDLESGIPERKLY